MSVFSQEEESMRKTFKPGTWPRPIEPAETWHGVSNIGMVEIHDKQVMLGVSVVGGYPDGVVVCNRWTLDTLLDILRHGYKETE